MDGNQFMDNLVATLFGPAPDGPPARKRRRRNRPQTPCLVDAGAFSQLSWCCKFLLHESAASHDIWLCTNRRLVR